MEIRLKGALKLIIFSPTSTAVVRWYPAQFFPALLGEIHHPEIIFVSHIKFQHGKFRIVGSVHPFVAEVSGNSYTHQNHLQSIFSDTIHLQFANTKEYPMHCDA
jgi:hypothetical protein